MRKIILSKEAPEPIGPYSQAIELNGVLYCSGQIPLNPKTGEIVGATVAEQTQQVMKNIEAVLKSANLGFADVVKTTIYLVDMADFQEVNSVYGEYFPKDPPARSTVAVRALPKSVKVEVEVLAARN